MQTADFGSLSADMATPQIDETSQMLHILGLLSKYSPRLDSYTLVCLLQGCISQGAFLEGKIIHTYLVKTGAQHNIFVWTALADMYTKHGNMEEAHKVFDAMPEQSLVSWNVMIAGYVKHGLIDRALELFKQMLSDGMHPDGASVMSMVQACVAARDLEWGRLLHIFAVIQSLDSNALLGNVMTDMYGKCGSLSDAHCVFERIQNKDSGSWAAMISVYALAELKEQSLLYFYEMLQQDVKPDNSIFLCILNVYASLGVLDLGRLIHSVIMETNVEQTINITNAIINMYGKCGYVDGAFRVLKSMHAPDFVSWNVMLAGFSQSGSGFQALELVLEMEGRGVNMDYITFVELLYACSHAGFLDIGIFIVIMHGRDHGMIASQDHYTGLIDLLGRAGNLDGALNVVYSFPFQPLPATWRSLLSACRIHNDLRKAYQAAAFLVDLELENDAAYLLLYNTFAMGVYAHVIWE